MEICGYLPDDTECPHFVAKTLRKSSPSRSHWESILDYLDWAADAAGLLLAPGPRFLSHKTDQSLHTCISFPGPPGPDHSGGCPPRFYNLLCRPDQPVNY